MKPLVPLFTCKMLSLEFLLIFHEVVMDIVLQPHIVF